MLMMAPERCSRITGRTCLHAMIVPRRLIAQTRSKASSLSSSSGLSSPAMLTPTLLCRISMYPQRPRAASTAAASVSSFVTSATKGTHSPPCFVAIAAVSSAEEMIRSTARIRAPSCAKRRVVAAVIAFTEQLALQNAYYGIRANCILPGLMDTPMAVDTRARASNRSRVEVAAERDARVPLRGRMGTGWDVANAALFLASDEANFITGVALPVDGGALVKVG